MRSKGSHALWLSLGLLCLSGRANGLSKCRSGESTITPLVQCSLPLFPSLWFKTRAYVNFKWMEQLCFFMDSRQQVPHEISLFLSPPFLIRPLCVLSKG